MKLFLFWFSELEEQFNVHNSLSICESTKNWSSNFAIIAFSCKHLITLTFFASCTLTFLRRSDFQSGPKSILCLSYQVFKQNLYTVTRRVLVEMHLCAMWLVNYERDTTIEIRIAAAIKEKKLALLFTLSQKVIYIQVKPFTNFSYSSFLSAMSLPLALLRI